MRENCKIEEREACSPMPLCFSLFLLSSLLIFCFLFINKNKTIVASKQHKHIPLLLGQQGSLFDQPSPSQIKIISSFHLESNSISLTFFLSFFLFFFLSRRAQISPSL